MADNIALKDGTGAAVTLRTTDIAGVQHNMSIPIDITGTAIFGSKTDNKNSATNTTSVSVISLLKQISASVQAAVTGIASSTYQLLSAAATTNATSVKASAGTLYAVTLFNASAANKYLKLYNKASAPTVGSDTPILTFLLPPGGSFFLDRPAGITFSTGIAFAITGAAAVADTTALTAGDILCLNAEYA